MTMNHLYNSIFCKLTKEMKTNINVFVAAMHH